MIRIRLLALAVICGVSLTVDATAQLRQFVGPSDCTGCHEDQKEWAEKRDGDGKTKKHVNAINRLAEPKANAYARALAIADVYDPRSTCVKCHATVVKGAAAYGVTCETCHGAGKDYLEPHVESYTKGVALGMKDVWKKPENWVRECLTCHVLGFNPGDVALIAAGHTSGNDFALSTKFLPVSSHWTSKYSANQIAALAEPVRTEILATRSRSQARQETGRMASGLPAVSPAVTLDPALLAKPGFPTSSPLDDPLTIGAYQPEADLPRTREGIVSLVQGRLISLLTTLLANGATIPQRIKPSPPKTISEGPDAALLNLQQEVIALALEALAAAPPPKKTP